MLQASCARVLFVSLSKNWNPTKASKWTTTLLRTPLITTTSYFVKNFHAQSTNESAQRARVACLLSLSLNNTLCLEIPLSKCELLQRLAHTQRLAERTGQAFSFFSSGCKGRIQKLREGRRWGRGISYILYCERKERYVEWLSTTTTNSMTDKARRDKTKVAITWASERFRAQRSGAERETKVAVTWASERFRAHRFWRRERGREYGREGARGHQPQTSHKTEQKWSTTQFITCREDIHHLILFIYVYGTRLWNFS